ncbi:type II toxin-antitoxin system VapC family toxin [Armatimonas sp.]|uniref:type II toxin-antitoxin system VapC family toxin n=1 Tax=Armatimonas sp. TaxID=1872638 RepID=UPI0037536305
MILYLLDTDTLSLLLRRDLIVQDFVKALPPQEFGTSIISYEEQIVGRFAQLRRARTTKETVDAYEWLQKTVELLAPIPLVGFAEASLMRFEALLALKLNVGPNDLRIASVALEIGAAVVTRNLRDYSRVPGLRIATWVEPKGEE